MIGADGAVLFAGVESMSECEHLTLRLSVTYIHTI